MMLGDCFAWFAHMYCTSNINKYVGPVECHAIVQCHRALMQCYARLQCPNAEPLCRSMIPDCSATVPK